MTKVRKSTNSFGNENKNIPSSCSASKFKELMIDRIWSTSRLPGAVMLDGLTGSLELVMMRREMKRREPWSNPAQHTPKTPGLCTPSASGSHAADWARWSAHSGTRIMAFRKGVRSTTLSYSLHSPCTSEPSGCCRMSVISSSDRSFRRPHRRHALSSASRMWKVRGTSSGCISYDVPN